MSPVASPGRVVRWPRRAALTLILTVAVAPAARADTPAAPAAPAGYIVGVAADSPNSVRDDGVGLAPGVRLVTGEPGAARRLRRARGVRYVEPNRVFRAAQAPSVVTQLLAHQWALGAINVLPAWNVHATGSPVVAVLDSGLDVAHPDLARSLWRNPSPTVGDVNGYNVLTRTGNLRDPSGHGTAVAGIVGAVPSSGVSGVTGVASRARLMGVKVLDDSGNGNTATVVAGIRYALRHGARIINLSLTGPAPSTALQEQIRAANNAGAVVVASAGNHGADLAAQPQYPASFPEPNIIGVASTSREGALSSFSNRGGPVSLAAPGESILTTMPGSAYGAFSGTSASTPHVTGAVALLRAARPDATVAQLRAALEDGARRSAALAGKVHAGQLDVSGAMTQLGLAGPAPRAAAVKLRVRVVRRGHRRPVLRWTVKGDGARRIRVKITGRRGTRVRSFSLKRRSMTIRRAPGRYRWRVTALGADNHALAVRKGRLRVRR